jgi:spectinomycin phosphotransferase
VYARPADLTDAELAGALRQHWRIDVADLRYAALGYGGYHWTATDSAGARWFATATRLAGEDQLTELQATMSAALHLAGAGLDFVLAPARAVSGDAVIRIRPDYAVTMFPFADGKPGTWGEPISAPERAAITSMLAALHAATPAAGPVPVRALNPPSRSDLEISLRERGRPWRGGPYAEAARDLLSEHAAGLAAALAVFDDLIGHVTGAGAQLVLTHGEPHPGNLIRCGDDRLLIDWDSVGLAPPERDLWWVLSDSGAEAAWYAEITGRAVDPAAIALYRLRWDLDDAGLLLAEFRGPHVQDRDTEVGWASLGRAVENLANWRPPFPV